MLFKTKTLQNYQLDSLDGEIGKFLEFYFDDTHWTVRYLVIDTRNWWPGKKVLISPEWIERVSWSENKVFVNLSRAVIETAPEYVEEGLITRDYEKELFRHYGRDVYWAHERDQLSPSK